MSIKPRQHGFSLIEQILFIVIISVGVLGLLGVMSLSASRQGADPLLQKQALAIAESLLAEIQRQPFSYCDPDDANATLAQSASECSAGLSQDTLDGPVPATESRNGASGSSYDNVTDYARSGGLVLNDVSDAGNPARVTMTGYTATIRSTWADTTFGLASGSHAALRIEVSVSNGPANVTLSGYRLRYAPQL